MTQTKLVKIIDRIYISNFEDAQNISLLLDNNIKIIINCSSECIYQFKPMFNIINLNLKEDDTDNLKIKFNYVYDYLTKCIKNRYNILIFSNSGQSRSLSILILFLIKYYNINFINALEIINSKYTTNIKENYYKQLFNYTIH
jgi:hypothetical protein